MDANAFLIQTAVVLPVIVGLVAYTLLRWRSSPLHQLVFALLLSLVPWLLGILVKGLAEDPTWRLVGLHAEHLSVIAMPPLFLIAMGQFARIRALEPGQPLFVVLVAAPFFWAALYLTDRWHGLYFVALGPALDAEHPRHWAGPLYWASQVWCALQAWSGVLCLVAAVWGARTRHERGRAALVLGAIFVPILAHLVYLTGLQPFDYSLAPLTLGVTTILFVYGVETHGVLDPQPILRTDVIEHLRDALVLADTAGNVLDANRAAEAALRCDRRALRGQPLTEVLGAVATPEDARALGERIARLAPGEGHTGGELLARDGRVFEVTVASVRAHGSHPAGVFLSLRDRTVQRRNERLLRERQKLESVGILAAGVAHEVNNPLAFVRANLVHLQALASEVEKVASGAPGEISEELLEMPEILAESLEGIERIGRIVESMLRFSRAPEEGVRRVDLNAVVRESMRLADLHRDRAVQVESVLEPELPPVLGSADRLVQVMLNLFLNGKQALSGIPDAQIVAETARGEGAAIVRVRDNGPGISEEDQQRIFDPFFTTRGPEGTGLGLSIAFDIAREHGGFLEVESQTGRGTCFTLHLPFAPIG